MGTMMKVSAAVLVAAAGVYFVMRTPQAESPRMAAVDSPPAADVEPIDAELVSAVEGPATEAGRRSQVAEEAPVGVAAAFGTNVLRVILEGITEEDARMTTVTLTGVDERAKWPAEIRESWSCRGLTSEFALDPFFASVAGRGSRGDPRLHRGLLQPPASSLVPRVSHAGGSRWGRGVIAGSTQQVMSLLPLDPLLPGALPPDRRAAHELRKAQLRAAPPCNRTSRSNSFINLSPVSTKTGEGHPLRQPKMAGRSRAEVGW